MAERIRVTPNELHMRASELRRCANDLEKSRKQIGQVLSSMDCVWQGDQTSSLISKAKQNEIYIEELRILLQTLADGAEMAAQACELADSSIIDSFRF